MATLSDNVESVTVFDETEEPNIDDTVTFNFYGNDRPFVEADEYLSFVVTLNLFEDEEGMARLAGNSVTLISYEATGEHSDDETTPTVNEVAKDVLYTSAVTLTVEGGSDDFLDYNDDVEFSITANSEGGYIAALESITLNINLKRGGTTPTLTDFHRITWTAYVDGYGEVDSGVFNAKTNRRNILRKIDFSTLVDEVIELADGDTVDFRIEFGDDFHYFEYGDGDKFTVEINDGSIVYTDAYDNDDFEEFDFSVISDLTPELPLEWNYKN